MLVLLSRSHRSSYPECSVKKHVPKNFAKFTEKHLRRSLSSIIPGACVFLRILHFQEYEILQNNSGNWFCMNEKEPTLCSSQNQTLFIRISLYISYIVSGIGPLGRG